MKEFTIDGGFNFIRYLDLPGKEAPILFIHGLGCAGSFDYPMTASQPPLCAHRRILIDLLGFGYSDKPEDFDYAIDSHVNYLENFICYLGVPKIIIYAHSMGGPIGIRLTERLGSKVKHLILAEGNLDAGGGTTSSAIYNYGYENYVKYGFDDMVQRSKNADNGIWASSYSLCSKKASFQLSQNLVEGNFPSWRCIFYKLPCKKTYVFGEKNYDEAEAKRFSENGIAVQSIKNAGHSMSIDNPSHLAEVIKIQIDQ